MPASKPKTILYVHNSDDLYGAEVILLNLIQALDPSRFRAIVALPTDAQHIGRFSARLAELEIPYIFLPLGILRRRYLHPTKLPGFAMEVFQGVNRLRDLIRREDVDLVHTNTLAVLSAALAAKLTQRKHIWHVHEFLATHAHIRKFLHWMAVRFSDRVVTVSNAVRQHILRDQPEACDSIVTLYNGIRLEPLLNLQTEPILRREFNIPPNAPVVGMVGRVSRWKGQSLLVEAAKIVQEVRPDVHFIAVGGVFDNETHYMDDFLRLVRERGLQQFHISDFRKDIPQVLASYDLFVLPSLEPDPFPTVIVEAQASAKPVVGAAHGGVPEMIIDGATGLLFRPNDPHDLAEKLLSLLDHPAEIQRMSAAARERALSAFQISRFAREFQDLYSSVLEEHAS